MIICFLCRRQCPQTKAVNVERNHWACGEPRHCHEYAQCAAAQRILTADRPRLNRRERALLDGSNLPLS